MAKHLKMGEKPVGKNDPINKMMEINHNNSRYCLTGDNETA